MAAGVTRVAGFVTSIVSNFEISLNYGNDKNGSVIHAHGYYRILVGGVMIGKVYGEARMRVLSQS